MGAPIVHFEINGPDSAASRSFYGELFGWSLQPVDGMPYTMVDTGNGEGSLAGGIGEPPDGASFVTVYAQVDDIPATLAKAEELGGRTLMPRMELPQVTIGMLADPQGRPFGLVEARRLGRVGEHPLGVDPRVHRAGVQEVRLPLRPVARDVDVEQRLAQLGALRLADVDGHGAAVDRDRELLARHVRRADVRPRARCGGSARSPAPSRSGTRRAGRRRRPGRRSAARRR